MITIVRNGRSVHTKERQRPHDTQHRLEQARLPDQLGREEEAEDEAV